MDFTLILFYVFATVLVLASVMVITSRNAVHAALFLVLAFFNAAGVWMLLQAEFLAITLVLVYVGAVMVLFLFVVMMLDINIERIRQGFWSYLPLGLVVAVVLVSEMVLVVARERFGGQAIAPVVAGSNTRQLAQLLFTDYAYPFEAASFVLLVAMLAAVMLTLRQRKGGKSVDPASQVAVQRNDRLRIVPMAAEKND